MRGFITGVILAWATSAGAQAPLLADPGPRLIGRDDAPVTFNLYLSPTCPHCAALYRDLFDDNRSDSLWPDALDARLKAGDFSIRLHPGLGNSLDLVTDMLARCSSDYGEALWRLFQTQEIWSLRLHPRARRPDDAFAGRSLVPSAEVRAAMWKTLLVPDLMTAERFDACIRDQVLADAVVAAVRADEARIDAWPSIIGADGTVIGGTPQILKAIRNRLCPGG